MNKKLLASFLAVLSLTAPAKAGIFDLYDANGKSIPLIGVPTTYKAPVSANTIIRGQNPDMSHCDPEYGFLKVGYDHWVCSTSKRIKPGWDGDCTHGCLTIPKSMQRPASGPAQPVCVSNPWMYVRGC